MKTSEITQLLSFKKFVGAGNDFVIVEGPPSLSPQHIQALCHRQYGAGADGCIFLTPCDKADFTMHFFNCNGQKAKMCGNGLRCAIAYCHSYLTDKSDLTLEVSGRIYKGSVDQATGLILSSGYLAQGHQGHLKLEVESMAFEGCFIEVGVPHFVCFLSEALDTFDVNKWGKALRQHPQFGSEGSNINFCMYSEEKQQFFIRTYERGVEGETLACGTGVLAAAICYHQKTSMLFPMNFICQSGEELSVFARGKELFLKGPAKEVFQGSWPIF